MRGLPFILPLLLASWVGSVAQAQIVVERTVTADLTIPDNGTNYSQFWWTNAGLSSISGTQVTVNFLPTDANNPIVLGQYSSALRFEPGTANGITNSVFGTNGLNSLSQTFNLGAVFSNAVLGGTNSWALFLTDTQGGGVGELDTWKLALEGTSAGAGSTMDLGSGGTVRVASSANSTQTVGNVATGAAGNTATVEAGAGQTLDVAGVVSGAGNLTKSGAGTVILSGSSANTFTNAATVSAGTLNLNKTAGATAISGSSIAVNSGGTLLLGAANQIADGTAITMSGGTLNMGGFADTVGTLTVNSASTFNFGNGVGSTSTFTFSDINLATYEGSGSQPVLTFSGVNLGSQIVFNTAYANTGSFNTFISKISFSDTSLNAQINFGTSGSTTTLTVAAIPEPRVYAAAAVLTMLIGFAEYRRRRRIEDRS